VQGIHLPGAFAFRRTVAIRNFETCDLMPGWVLVGDVQYPRRSVGFSSGIIQNNKTKRKLISLRHPPTTNSTSRSLAHAKVVYLHGCLRDRCNLISQTRGPQIAATPCPHQPAGISDTPVNRRRPRCGRGHFWEGCVWITDSQAKSCHTQPNASEVTLPKRLITKECGGLGSKGGCRPHAAA